jgi:hypothetical protein
MLDRITQGAGRRRRVQDLDSVAEIRSAAPAASAAVG